MVFLVDICIVLEKYIAPSKEVTYCDAIPPPRNFHSTRPLNTMGSELCICMCICVCIRKRKHLYISYILYICDILVLYKLSIIIIVNYHILIKNIIIIIITAYFNGNANGIARRGGQTVVTPCRVTGLYDRRWLMICHVTVWWWRGIVFFQDRLSSSLSFSPRAICVDFSPGLTYRTLTGERSWCGSRDKSSHSSLSISDMTIVSICFDLIWTLSYNVQRDSAKSFIHIYS